MRRVVFIDTSVLCELLAVPGKSQQADACRREFAERVERGEQFVLPITAVIEAGNHIAQASGDRRAAATRLVDWLRRAVEGRPPLVLDQVTWDDAFLADLCAGDATSQPLVDLVGNGQMGTGDVAILVERDRFVSRSAFSRNEVPIWTLEHTMQAYA